MMTSQSTCPFAQIEVGAPFWFDSPTAPGGSIAILEYSAIIAGAAP